MTACIVFAAFAQVSSAGAVPALPSSFYGTVRVNAANVPDGTQVQALIGGQVVAVGVTQTYQGDSVYVLDVPGDNPDTSAKDGGREGDVIQFSIGGVLAEQTGQWRSGTNVNLNLTAVSATPVNTPVPTLPPPPTQTDIVILPPTALPTSTATAPVTPVVLVPPSASMESSALPPAGLPHPTETMAATAEPRVVLPESAQGGGDSSSLAASNTLPQRHTVFSPQAMGAILISLVVVVFSLWRIGSRRK
ncbi:MAG: hypothetical protein WHV44_05410 [Anaerolineales bacterium]